MTSPLPPYDPDWISVDARLPAPTTPVLVVQGQDLHVIYAVAVFNPETKVFMLDDWYTRSPGHYTHIGNVRFWKPIVPPHAIARPNYVKCAYCTNDRPPDNSECPTCGYTPGNATLVIRQNSEKSHD